jgi:hypothetical protein
MVRSKALHLVPVDVFSGRRMCSDTTWSPRSRVIGLSDSGPEATPSLNRKRDGLRFRTF